MLESSVLTDGHSVGVDMEKQGARSKEEPVGPSQIESTIDILPYDVLLMVFYLYKEVYSPGLSWWEPLVHVCRRWRHVILGSPRLLNLTVVCTSKTPTRESLNIWPPFPIAIRTPRCDPPRDIENLIAALEHPDRVTDIRLGALTRSELMESSVTMECPFPVLTYLSLGWFKEVVDDEVALPDEFLGGSAPSLQTLRLERIAFPALPSLLSSTPQLVTLQLSSIPSIGYISPEVMATCLVALPNLKQLDLEPQSRFPNQHGYPPADQSLSTHPVLPSLASFHYAGNSNYLEDLLAQIDAPILQTFSAYFCNDIIRFPQLLRFVSSVERLGPIIRVMVNFDNHRVLLKTAPSDCFELTITSTHFIQHIVVICQALSPLLSHVERLDFYCAPHHTHLPIYFRPGTRWLDLLQPFINVKSLYVPKDVWAQLGLSLQFWTDMAREVLPELRTLFLEESQPSGTAQKSLESFIALRQLSDRPITIQQCTALDFDSKD